MNRLNKYIFMLACSVFAGQISINAMESKEGGILPGDEQTIFVQVSLAQNPDDTTRREMANLSGREQEARGYHRGKIWRQLLLPVQVNVTNGQVDAAQAINKLSEAIAKQTGRAADGFDMYFTRKHIGGAIFEGDLSLRDFQRNPDEAGFLTLVAQEQG